MPTSSGHLQAIDDLSAAERIAELGHRGPVAFDLLLGCQNLWIVANSGEQHLLALRIGFGGEIEGAQQIEQLTAQVFTWRSKLGAWELRIELPAGSQTTIRATTSLLPSRDVHLDAPTRDVFAPDDVDGTIHTAQRGLRSGVLFATCIAPVDFSYLYFQDFSSLGNFFELTGTSPAGTVGGTLSEGGYLLPGNENAVLPKSREVVVSDVHLAIVTDSPENAGEMPGLYLDLLADVYAGLQPRAPEYHDWPLRAQRAMRDLALSPKCTYERHGRQFFLPYVGDETKPPESMVQLTLLVNILEYDAWSGVPSAPARTLLDGIERFYDADPGSIVRWLPGEPFGPQVEENMSHEAMDSWYLYHALFNVSRLAALGNSDALTVFRNSLPFAIRVARRFAYNWPIFFNLRTLEILRAEASPGKGGENDVAGLYALVMLHAHELLGGEEYLQEAARAADGLRDLGFALGYQMNTTGFAAEAFLRLWQITKDRTYLQLSELCMANLFDNMWLWRCEYGLAKSYRTFFGLFPLPEAPYLAAYEELEAHAKFHEYLSLGGESVRTSLRYLIAEFQKYSLDRGWFYFPDSLAPDAVATEARNGRVERALSIPIEDLQDGRTPSGSVGQEIYGAGLPLIYTSRHYRTIVAANACVFCEYPLLDVSSADGGRTLRFKTGGDKRGSCDLRVIPLDANMPTGEAVVKQGSKRVRKAQTSVEGHRVFRLAGGARYELRLSKPDSAVRSDLSPASNEAGGLGGLVPALRVAHR